MLRSSALVGRLSRGPRVCLHRASRAPARRHKTTPVDGALGDAVAEINASPEKAAGFLQSLSPQAKLALFSSAIAQGQGSTTQKLFENVDKNSDGIVSQKEFVTWFQRYGRALTARTAQAPDGVEVAAATRSQMTKLFVVGMIPMVGFGFVDNFIMLTAGDAIDNTLGTALRISTLAAAGLGNLVSDVAGLGLSSSIEAWAGRLGIPPHGLTEAQLALGACRKVTLLASVLGISTGCLLGMVPLLFFDSEHKDLAAWFDELDLDDNGFIELDELTAVIDRLDLNVSREDLKMIVTSNGFINERGQMDFEQFKGFAKFVKDKSHIKVHPTLSQRVIKALPTTGTATPTKGTDSKPSA